MTPMRTRLLSPALFVVVACRTPMAALPDRPVVAPDHAAPVEVAHALAPEPAPEPAPPPEPPPTWAWAVSALPELAEHSEVDPSAAALARFVGWFDDGAPARVHVLLEGACHAIKGSISADGFHGRWQTRVTTRGDEREVSGMSFEIARGGITESGPGGSIFKKRKNNKGRWQEVGGFGMGSFHTLVDAPMTAADDQSVTFAGYTYRLEPVCVSTETLTQTCTAGGERSCGRCLRVWLKPQAEGMGWGSGTIGVGRVDPTPVDCTQPCPADQWTPLLPRLSAVLEGRQFSGVREGEGRVVFRSAKGCARELRRRNTKTASPRSMR